MLKICDVRVRRGYPCYSLVCFSVGSESKRNNAAVKCAPTDPEQSLWDQIFV